VALAVVNGELHRGRYDHGDALGSRP
jgi:hypothetical protein